MEIWILFYILREPGNTRQDISIESGSIEFSSQEACEAAIPEMKKMVAAMGMKDNRGPAGTLQARCLKK